MILDLDDRQLVEAAQADLYEVHFYRVYAYVARRVGDGNHAEDVTSEVLRDAFFGLPCFEWREVPFRAIENLRKQWEGTNACRGFP